MCCKRRPQVISDSAFADAWARYLLERKHHLKDVLKSTLVKKYIIEKEK